MVEAGSSPTCTVASPISPSSRTSSATSARIRSASVRPSISTAVKRSGYRQPNVAHDVLTQALDVTRAHRVADERALLRSPERVLDENRQQPIGRLHELSLRLLVGILEQHLLVGHPGAVVNAIVGREPVADLFEDRSARGARDQPETRDDQTLVEDLHLEDLLLERVRLEGHVRQLVQV